MREPKPCRATTAECRRRGSGNNTGISVSPLEEERRRLLQNLVVYFDYDQAEIRPEFNALLQAHGQNLAMNPNAQIGSKGTRTSAAAASTTSASASAARKPCGAC